MLNEPTMEKLRALRLGGWPRRGSSSSETHRPAALALTNASVAFVDARVARSPE